MAFPVVVSTATFGTGTNANSHSVTIPASVAGDLLVMALGHSNNVSASITGWSQVDSADLRHNVFWRIADGTEGTTATVTIGGGGSRVCAVTDRITGHEGTLAALEAINAATLTLDPPALTPTWGLADTLWMATGFSRKANWTFSSSPTNYGVITDIATVEGGTQLAQSRVGRATRELAATTEDPNAFTVSGALDADSSSSFLIAIRPAAAGTTTNADLNAGGFTLTGQEISASRSVAADLNAGSLAFTGLDLDAFRTQDADLASGSYALTGLDLDAFRSQDADLAASQFTFAGQVLTATQTLTAALASGSYTLSGRDIITSVTQSADLSTGVLTTTGFPLEVDVERQAALASGSYVFTGRDLDASIVIGTFTPHADAQFTVAAESRTSAVANENRTSVVANEKRTSVVANENRTFVVELDTRNFIA